MCGLSSAATSLANYFKYFSIITFSLNEHTLKNVNCRNLKNYASQYLELLYP